MDDIFYFNSPAKPLLLPCRKASAISPRVLLQRRRTCAALSRAKGVVAAAAAAGTMFEEGTTTADEEHTFVVHLAEPTFCPSTFASLPPPLLLHNIPSQYVFHPGDDWQHAGLAHMGGCPFAGEDEAMEDVRMSSNDTRDEEFESRFQPHYHQYSSQHRSHQHHHHHHHDFVIRSHDCVAATTTTTTTTTTTITNAPGRMQYVSIQIPRFSSTRDVMSTALQLPSETFHVPAGLVLLHESRNTFPEHTVTEQHSPIPGWAQVIDNEVQLTLGIPHYTTQSSTTSRDTENLWFARTSNILEENQQYPATWLLQDSTHHDAVPVDDPSRFHDFADFMHEWALLEGRSDIFDVMSNMHCTDRGSDQYCSSLGSRSNPTYDPQGLAWPAVGVTRNEALAARHALRPQARSQCRTATPPNHPIYNFRSHHRQHRAQCCHYQLRNLLAATSRADVFYACATSVKSTNLAAPSVEKTVMDFARPSTTAMPFRVTSLAASASRHDFTDYYSHSALVAGGFNGEYAVLDLTSEMGVEASEGFVSHAYDGLVTHIDAFSHRRSGGLHAVFSTNDCQIRVMDLQTLNIVHDVKYSHAVNASCMSPDGRLRLLVGDHHEALVADSESGTPLIRLDGNGAESFACAWSQDSRSVATASSTGDVVLWDARMLSKPTTTLQLAQCARSLHFTRDNILVMAEDDDNISFCDTKDNSRQDCSMFGSIAGVALLGGGDEIVVANTDRTVGGLLVLQQNRKFKHQYSYDPNEDSEYGFVI